MATFSDEKKTTNPNKQAESRHDLCENLCWSLHSFACFGLNAMKAESERVDLFAHQMDSLFYSIHTVTVTSRHKAPDLSG